MKKAFILTVAICLLCVATRLFAQPMLPPLPFEDSYRGAADSSVIAARVRIHNTYYKSPNDSLKMLYAVRKYNKQGRIVYQQWYNFITHKEMYTALYKYDSNGYFTESEEKITNQYEDFNYHAVKKSQDGFTYMYEKSGDSLLAKVIPMNDSGELVVKTAYSRNSSGIYSAKKYFYDGTFYKEKVYPIGKFNPRPFFNIYIGLDRMFECRYDTLSLITDTLRSSDSIYVTVRYRNSNNICFKILKKFDTQKHLFALQSFEIIPEEYAIKLYFSQPYDGYDLFGINYMSTTNQLLLRHQFQCADTILKTNIKLLEIENQEYLKKVDPLFFYTTFKNGYKYKEERFLLVRDNTASLEKVQDRYYPDGNNLLHLVKSYRANYLSRFGPYTMFFRYYDDAFIDEINEYEYFD
jgi:hypothetical protein